MDLEGKNQIYFQWSQIKFPSIVKRMPHSGIIIELKHNQEADNEGHSAIVLTNDVNIILIYLSYTLSLTTTDIHQQLESVYKILSTSI